MAVKIELAGKRFGKLVVETSAGRRGRKLFWKCACDCGNIKEVEGQVLREGRTRSCGCVTRTHGKTGTQEHAIWRGMRTRCNNPNASAYPKYGARGIRVCERWDSFENFLSDMGARPSKHHSVDRINPDGNYEPSNCRWATTVEQCNNRRATRYIEYRGERLALAVAVRRAGSVIHPEAAWVRIRTGWPVERALETPKLFESPASRSRVVPAWK